MQGGRDWAGQTVTKCCYCQFYLTYFATGFPPLFYMICVLYKIMEPHKTGQGSQNPFIQFPAWGHFHFTDETMKDLSS